MDCVNEIFPVILYFLGSILLISLIVLTIKVIKTVKKVDAVLNGVFDFVDNTTDALSIISDKLVGIVMSGISGLFSRRKKKEDDDNE